MILKRKQYSTGVGRTIAGLRKKILKQSPMKAKRLAVENENKIIDMGAKGINIVRDFKVDPGGVTDKAIGTVIKNPLTAATVPVIIAPGLTVGTAAVEHSLKKHVPLYKAATDGLHKIYKKSKVGDKVIRPAINKVVEIGNYLPPM